MADEDLGAEISSRLNAVIALLIRRQSKDGDLKRKIGDYAVLLRSFGIPYGEIAKILGSSENSVKVLVSQKKKTTKEGR